MMHFARVLADSVFEGSRLTTLEVTFPRIVLAEVNTHRRFSRNSASSRAIPVEKMIRMVQESPYVPGEWGSNQKGMQAGEELSPERIEQARNGWLSARDAAVAHAQQLLELGLHKQLTNRLLEPFMWHTAIISSTEWDNFFHLRCHPAAHPDIRITAEKMQAAIRLSAPEALRIGQWHLPLIFKEDREVAESFFSPMSSEAEYWGLLQKISVGRCARVSYLTHDGRRDLQADVQLHDSLLVNGHMSPFEHVARPWTLADDPDTGNFDCWVQYRKTIPQEWDRLGGSS